MREVARPTALTEGEKGLGKYRSLPLSAVPTSPSSEGDRKVMIKKRGREALKEAVSPPVGEADIPLVRGG